MRITCVASLAVTLVLSVGALAEEKAEHPFKDAKVGDYVTYKITFSIKGKDDEGSVKQTVAAKTDKEVTLRSVITPGEGQETTQTIDLTKPYDPVAFLLHSDNFAKFSKSGEGDEKVKVGDKTYECHWIAGKVTPAAGGLKVEADVKVWFSKSVPLFGMVKMESKGEQTGMHMELTGSGHGK
jgi:hypothetical protein